MLENIQLWSLFYYNSNLEATPYLNIVGYNHDVRKLSRDSNNILGLKREGLS